LNKYELWLEQAESEIRFDAGKLFLTTEIYSHLFIGSPIVDFSGIDTSFLDAADENKINALTHQEKTVYVSKVIEACQYLRNRATPQEREDGTVYCVWNIQYWCLYAYWFPRSPRVENGCQIWKGPVCATSGYVDYPVLKFSSTADNT
jgi:hypothetical protein